MATEAVLKIVEAEDKAKEIIRSAGDAARQTVAAAQKAAAEKKKLLIAQALQSKAEQITAASQKAEKDCAPLIAEGAKARRALLSPDPANLEKAITLIMERTVRADGNI